MSTVAWIRFGSSAPGRRPALKPMPTKNLAGNTTDELRSEYDLSSLKGRVRGQVLLTCNGWYDARPARAGRGQGISGRQQRQRGTSGVSPYIASRSRQAAEAFAASGGTSIIKEAFQPARLKRGQCRGVDLVEGRTRKDEPKCPREHAREGRGVLGRNIRKSSVQGTLARDSTSVRPVGPDRSETSRGTRQRPVANGRSHLR